MTHRCPVFLIAILLIIGGCASPGAIDTGEKVTTLPAKPRASGHAPVNGIDMYYEVHGPRDGVPLVLLHGGGSTLEVTGGHGDYLGEAVTTQRATRYPELTARLIEEFLGSP